ncbi:MAG: M23 family metallopeptidase [Anaerolineales bacterium]|nr:M23 family metallopeptidase [Anaerolineales bacterium]
MSTWASRAVRLGLAVLLGCLGVWPGGARSTRAAAAADFADWHLPLPAGEWRISRGPCGAGGLFTHQCGYYEDHCALDLTPMVGSMENVPVLAPQSGQVFFVGTRSDSGLTVMLEHADGRVSALMHLARIVVAPDERVIQGQVVAYAGNSGSSTRPHLHFHVQPNVVERTCLPLDTLDDTDLRAMTVRSYNLAWTDLELVDPPDGLPSWLPLLNAAALESAALPQRLILAPGTTVGLPVAIRTTALMRGGVAYAGRRLTAVAQTETQKVFIVPVAAPAATGEYAGLLQLSSAWGGRAAGRALRLRFAVRAPPVTGAGARIVWISPIFVGPANWSELAEAPRLCWSEPASAGPPPLLFRARVAGPIAADSGWIAETCWQTPDLVPGTYAWKVFVRDSQGYMNRTNQRPFVFRLR